MQKNPILLTFLLIFLSFLVTSAGYLSWLYHLIDLYPEANSELLSEVLGYIFQAVGLLLFSFASKKRPSLTGRSGFIFVMLAFIIVLIPCQISTSFTLIILCGLLMNLICGLIAGFYLFLLADLVPERMRGKVFGFGYGISCIVVWLISMSGGFLYQSYSLIVYAVLAILAAGIYYSRIDVEKITSSNLQKKNTERKPDVIKSVFILAFVTVILLSLVKNLGFAFPTKDLITGLDITFSRVFYGAGLILAGLINDKSRKSGSILCLAALIIPFLMLFLSGEAVSATILWGLNYFFFGFFSVYRVILYSDLSEKNGLLWLAGFGLLAGRIGDAAGTFFFLQMQDNTSVLVIVTATLFVVTVFLFFRLFQQIYIPAAAQQKSAEERFEHFSMQYSLSQRERDIVKLLLNEMSNQDMASALFVSESTVKFHVHNILKKTGCKNRVELLALYHSS